jgi:integrase
MTVREAFAAFIAAGITEGKAPATIQFYEGRFVLIDKALGDKDIQDVRSTDILTFAQNLPPEWSNTTKRHALSVIDILQNWLWRLDLLEKKWMKKIFKPPMGRRDKLPTGAQTAALLAVANRAFQLMYTGLRLTGARPGELCAALMTDWRRDEHRIILKKHKTARKTCRARQIPVSSHFLLILEESTAGRTEGPLFLTQTGRPWTPQYLSRCYTVYRQQAGLPDGLVLYLARHEAGTKACKKYGIAVARDLLGHTNISTTSRYVHPSMEEVLEAAEGLSDELTRLPEGLQTVEGCPAPQPATPPEPPPPKPRIQIRATLSGGAADGRRLDQDADRAG